MKSDNNIFSDLIVEILGDYKMQKLQYFAIIASALRIAPTDNVKTAGIFIYENNPNVYLLYNVDYVIKLDTKQKRFLFYHLLFHLILKTKERASTNFHNPAISNLVHDMIINKLLFDSYGKYIDSPVKNIILPPKDYTDILTYESLYDFIEDEINKTGNLMKYIKNSGTDIIDETLAKAGQTLDTHMDDGINEITMPSALRELSKTIDRGLESSNMVEMITGIMATGKINVLEYIDKFTRAMKGNIRRKTWNRRNRKFPGLIKGHRKKVVYFNLILDTSASMGTDELKNLLEVIMKNGISFNLIQIDTQIKDMLLIRNIATLEALEEFKGRGGTELQPALDYCLNNNINEPVVILTDGYTDSLTFHTNSLIIYTGSPCPIIKGNHLVTQIKFEK